jgi:hypothetical protein
LLLLFAFGMYAAAWQAETTAPSDQAGAAAASESIIGCLQSSSADAYTLQSTEGNVQVEAKGDLKNDISKHVGHQVRLVGSWEEGAAAAAGDAQPAQEPGAEGTETAQAREPGSDLPQSDQPMADSHAGKKFKAERVEMISQSCSAAGQSEAPKP